MNAATLIDGSESRICLQTVLSSRFFSIERFSDSKFRPIFWDGKGLSFEVFLSLCLSCTCFGFKELRTTLGETVMQTLVPLLKQTLQTYAEKPSEFHRELQFYFGFGALTLERMIVKELFQKLNLHYTSSSELDFETSIGLARKDLSLLQRGVTRK